MYLIESNRIFCRPKTKIRRPEQDTGIDCDCPAVGNACYHPPPPPPSPPPPPPHTPSSPSSLQMKAPTRPVPKSSFIPCKCSFFVNLAQDHVIPMRANLKRVSSLLILTSHQPVRPAFLRAKRSSKSLASFNTSGMTHVLPWSGILVWLRTPSCLPPPAGMG